MKTKFWALYCGSTKIDLEDKEAPVAYFRNKGHAIKFGRQMWPQYFEVVAISLNVDFEYKDDYYKVFNLYKKELIDENKRIN